MPSENSAQLGATAHITIFLPHFDNGGVERMLVNLANGFNMLGARVDFIVCRRDRPYLNLLHENIHLMELGNTGEAAIVTATRGYLRKERPIAMLCAKETSLELALKARQGSGSTTRIYARAVTNSSRQLMDKNIVVRWFRRAALRRMYRDVDGVIAVSAGVAEDARTIANLSADKIQIAPNPVITPQLHDMAATPLNHPWFSPDQPPVILGVGRLSRAKNFPLLLEAFARVRRQRDCRLLILGEGRQRAHIENLADRLGVRPHVKLPGFVENPYPFLRHAALFVLSSHWEGSPNVLTESLALGTPAVATDCPSGPREILQDGRYGALVPLDDPDALATAMLDSLAHPLPAEVLQSAVAAYTVENSAREYLRAMGLART